MVKCSIKWRDPTFCALVRYQSNNSVEMTLALDQNVPADCGKRLLPAVLDEIAANDPQRIFISVPHSSDLSQGFRDIDYGTFGKAVNKYAHWLRAQFNANAGPETILYFGPLDIRYLLVILGTPKAGHIVSCYFGWTHGLI
jgi:hypothetical protein